VFVITPPHLFIMPILYVVTCNMF